VNNWTDGPSGPSPSSTNRHSSLMNGHCTVCTTIRIDRHAQIDKFAFLSTNQKQISDGCLIFSCCDEESTLVATRLSDSFKTEPSSLVDSTLDGPLLGLLRLT
jgi:hypothetical protein